MKKSQKEGMYVGSDGTLRDDEKDNRPVDKSQDIPNGTEIIDDVLILGDDDKFAHKTLAWRKLLSKNRGEVAVIKWFDHHTLTGEGVVVSVDSSSNEKMLHKKGKLEWDDVDELYIFYPYNMNESMIPTLRDVNKMSKDQLIRIQGILFGRSDQKKILNAIRKRLEQIDSDISEDEGISYLTPDAFDKNKKSTGASDIYYYKLGFKPVPKKIKGAGTIVKKLWEKEELTEYSDFQQKRISTFDEVEEKLNSLSPLLSNAKSNTAEYYNENPGSYAIVYSTDMVNELLDDITELLKQEEWKGH